MDWAILKHHRMVLEMLKLTPNKKLNHTTTQDNAMQRCLLKPWRIYNYTKAVCKLLLDWAAASPSRMPTITVHQIKKAGQQSSCAFEMSSEQHLSFWGPCHLSPGSVSDANNICSPCTTELIITRKNKWLTNSPQFKTCFQSPRKFTSVLSEGEGIAVMWQQRMESMNYFLFAQCRTSSPSPCMPLMHLRKYLWVLIQILQLINLISHSLG